MTTQPDDLDAARKVVEMARMRTPAEIVQWIREQPTIEQAVQVLTAHVRAVVEGKEARIRELERLGMEEVERGLKLEAALADQGRADA